ncbi:alpha/beta hydrolase fold domain-containing protein [Massilia sp. FT127W]|uniref:Alpha/beta hydrolase fold domain-containing protein n=2 Tax=Pseudoduganella aquatica TaxID=2660641 RepID=A0A7X4KQ75_9BURK|nr:alpha/beta hydrolase fold domain-containing protein [Pseudoduganella aquatica]
MDGAGQHAAALYQGYSAAELDRQYNARATVPDATIYLRAYAEQSAAMRADLPCHCGVAYGAHEDEQLDIFPAPKPGSPVLVYIHGGYWRALSKDDSSFMAATFTAAGATVVAVNYSLAPGVSLDHIVDQNRRALAWVHRHIAQYNGDAEKIYLCGSSAGGHLVGMLLAPGWQPAHGLPANAVAGACPISGLMDLAPIPATHINEWAKLDAAAARRLSPLHHLPEQGGPLISCVGGAETAEFRRQSRSYADAWRARGLTAEYLEIEGANHFDVVLELAKTDSPLTRALLRMMGLAG